MRVIEGLCYSPAHGDARQMDIFIPGEGANGRCVLWIHGGGWRGGRRASWRAPAELFCEYGYVCASMDYRLVPTWTFPSQIEDARLAMAFLRSKAAEYGFRANATAAIGSSAGGHLAAMLGVIRPQNPLGAAPDSPPRDTQPNAVVCVCAPTTLMADEAPGSVLPPIFCAFMGCDRQENPSLWRSASPLEGVTGSEPPFLFVHGNADTTVPIAHSERMRDKLLAAGVKAEMTVIDGAAHGFAYGVTTPLQQQTMTIIRRFLDRALPTPATTA